MARYIVAVSGGIDSVVLLDMLSRLTPHQLVVAHFDHGIRPESAQDAKFVSELAQRYGLPFETRREELGSTASEAVARTRRYAFLRDVSRKYDAQIVTAHHADDAVESVAINLTRGTGWRGLASLDSDIVRPILHLHKAEIADYAHRRGLTWREDATNQSDAYLRNRIRKSLKTMPTDEKRQILALRSQQLHVKKLIEKELKRLIGPGPSYSRYFFSHIPHRAALEGLRFVTKGQLTRPQLERALLAIKTARPSSRYEAGGSITLRFTTRNFSL